MMSQTRNAMHLEGKRVLITGAGSGIARSASVQMATDGAEVWGLDWSAQGLEGTGELVRAAGGTWHALTLDVSDSAKVREAVAAVLRTWDRIDVLVNVAGVVSLHRVVDMPDEEWERVLRVNLSGTFHLCKAVLPGMLARGSGSIVNVASGKAFRGMNQGAHYAASKGGMVSFTYSLADELKGTGVRANTVIPGNTLTPMTDALRAVRGEAGEKKPPAGQAPEDVAELILFLASDRSRMLNGQAIGKVWEPSGK
jgi:NAD(P)-dependent dehydrogenase (short-subunit alcohol dehydrogenase family)